MNFMRNKLALGNKKLSLFEYAWLTMPVLVWFGYYPVLSIGHDSTTNYEFSLPLIALVVLAIIGLPSVWKARNELLRSRAVWLASLFVVVCGLTLFWTPNLLRGSLTFGIVASLFLVLLAAIAERKRLKKLLPALAKLCIASGVIMSGAAIVQMIAGIWLPREATLLCAGCSAEQFGFARPNVFAIEPQFLGSLLLAPLLLAVYEYLNGMRQTAVVASSVLLSLGLFLTLSRGAIIAAAVGLIVLLIVTRAQLKWFWRVMVFLAVGFLGALTLQGTAAAVNPHVESSFVQAVSSSINQLSLGKITLVPAPVSSSSTTESEPTFDGYVEESTSTRLSLSQLALGTWASTPTRMMFGVGLGGAGVAMHEQYPDTIDAHEIVQNQYVEILLECGFVGFALFITLIVGLVTATRHNKWSWAIAAAFLVQWLFFSGYPNALHVYVTLIIIVASCLTGLAYNHHSKRAQ